MPLKKAEDLLACLLEVSRGWTTQTWYTSNGVKGRSHSRSRAFHIPTAKDCARVSGTDPENVLANGTAREAGRYAESRPTTTARRRGSTEISTGETLGGSADERFQSSDGEEFDYDGGSQGEDSASVGLPSGVPQSYAEGSRDETTKVVLNRNPAEQVPHSAGRPSQSEHLKPSENLEEAPAELLEIVPAVVEAVRRYSTCRAAVQRCGSTADLGSAFRSTLCCLLA